jgi:hypothetical protein
VEAAPADSIFALAAVVRFSFAADAIVATSIAVKAVRRRRDVATKERRARGIKRAYAAASCTPSAIAATALDNDA